MPQSALVRNIKYYAAFQLVFATSVILLSSVGAFFHFLLDHEISIVEAWLHNNQWEILIVAKLAALFVLNRWFRIKLYELKSVRQLVGELVRWPDKEAGVISVFIALSCLALGEVFRVSGSFGYWYYNLTSFLGLFLLFGIEFIVIAYLDDVLNTRQQPSRPWLGIAYTLLFTLAFRISVPDYYGLLPYVVFCYTLLLLLSGESFKKWSNVVCLLLLFIAPMGAVVGLDPVWGEDFSPMRLKSKLNLASLVAIWVISFCYYRFRNQFINSAHRLLQLR
jgi:succinate dehydrogenase hydrophobic anchor subunit